LVLEGVCKNDRGQALSGVRVLIHEAQWINGEALRGSVVAEGLSDARGRFEFVGVLRRGNQYQLLARGESLGSHDSGVIDPLDGGSLWQDVMLAETPVALIRVLDPQGGGVVGARLLRPDRDGEEFASNAEATIALHGLPIAGLVVEVSAAGFSRECVEVAPGTNVTVTLRSALGVSGRVVLRGTQQGLAKTQLSLRAVEGSDAVWQCVSGSDGRFRFDGVPDGLLVLSLPAFAALARNVSAGAENLMIEVDEELQVHGLVRGPRGVRGARVALVDSKEAGSCALMSSAWRPAKEDGSFAIAARSAGPWHVVAEAPGYARAVSSAVTAPGAVHLDLTAGFSIAGQALDEQGAPLAGARVLLRRVVELKSRATGGIGGLARGAAMHAQSSGDGSFALSNLEAGAYELTLEHPSFVSPKPTRLDVQGNGRLAPLRLQRAGELEGLVTLSDGAGDHGASVLLTSLSDERHLVTADSEGRFSLGGLVPGTWTARLVRPGSGPSADSFPNETALRVDIRAGRKSFLNIKSR
jgi:hypothetical protein